MYIYMDLKYYQSLHLDKVNFALIYHLTYAVTERISLAQNDQESRSNSANQNFTDCTTSHS